MWQGFGKRGASGGRCGLAIGAERVALAYVQQGNGGAMRLAAAAVDRRADEDGWLRRLEQQASGIHVGKNRVASVLPNGAYQLVLVEVPNVPASEVKSAVRWKIKDLLDFPVDEAVIELFQMPEQSSATKKPMAYAVATRRSRVQEHIELLHNAGLALDVIDIPELCTRNIATRLPQDAGGVAFLHFADNHGTLTITRQGVLYLIRQIEKGLTTMHAASGDDFASNEVVSKIVLETQRSLDYYESHFNYGPVTELVLAPGSNIGGLADSLHGELGLTISSLDLNGMFETGTAMSTTEQSDCLLAIGAALRDEPQAA
ncbi:MAG: pilus assembly protein PilM [Gammaproteobacteria bacterium]|nr:pilus assembly protein PilM [Gammaproteobacteria bacterium]MDH3481580.1 pilus assembly protein PilM [Gammaproteobacteria bacterium]